MQKHSKSRRTSKSTLKSEETKAAKEGRMIGRLIQTFDRFPPETHDELSELLCDLSLSYSTRDPGAMAVLFTSGITRLAKLLDHLSGDAWREELNLDMCFAVNRSEDETEIANRPETVVDFQCWRQSHPRPIRRCAVEA